LATTFQDSSVFRISPNGFGGDYRQAAMSLKRMTPLETLLNNNDSANLLHQNDKMPDEIEIKRQKILDALKSAFESEPYPGDLEIVYDNTGEHVECNQICDAFRGRTNVLSQYFLDYLPFQYSNLFFFTE
jgi:hypothetical protein